MTKPKRMFRKTGKTVVALAAAGSVLATSCSGDALRAIAVGLQAATDSLGSQGGTGNDLTFGEWLLSELK